MHDCRPHITSRTNFLAAAGAAATMLLPGARVLAQPARPRMIDIHHHHYPPALIAQMNASQAQRGQPPVSPTFWTPEKSLADMDASGIGLPTSFGNKWPGDAAFAPFFAEANRRKAMVVFHPYAPNCCTPVQS